MHLQPRVCLALVTLLVVLGSLGVGTAGRAAPDPLGPPLSPGDPVAPASRGPSVGRPPVGAPALSALSPLAGTLPDLAAGTEPSRQRAGSPQPARNLSASVPALPVDPVLQAVASGANMPAPTLSFDGLSNVDGAVPPDPNGAVGPNHYVQIVNFSVIVFNKSGTLLQAAKHAISLFAGYTGINAGNSCATRIDANPFVVYDHLADRWLLGYSTWPNVQSGPSFLCLAISQTPDPTAAYYLYDFRFSPGITDRLRLGVWPDAYYVAMNQYTNGGATSAGVGVAAFERSAMLQGQSARQVFFDLFAAQPNAFGLLPAHLDGTTLPPPGAPNYFAELTTDASGNFTNQLSIFAFHVDWGTPASSSFTGPTVVDVAPFTPLCLATRDCLAQPGTTQKLDALSNHIMPRLEYRNFGSYEVMVTNHTVDSGGGQAGIRWYEVRRTGGVWAIFQQGTYAGDGTNSEHRWVGSIGMDSAGNMALGYSVSSTTVFPSIRYVGRLATDPLNTLPQGETTLLAGAGSQTGANRWGDYSMMRPDPAVGCQFWYTQEYYPATSATGWHTGIGAFHFPSCTPIPTPTATPSPTWTPTASATPTVTPPATATLTATSTATATATAHTAATQTPTATSTPTRTPTVTPTPFPQPNLGVQVAPSGTPGRLRVTLTPRDAGCSPNNQLTSLHFTSTTNAAVDAGTVTGGTGDFTVSVQSPGPFTFFVNRVAPGASTATLIVTDGCGPWPTFVGGGPSAF